MIGKSSPIRFILVILGLSIFGSSAVLFGGDIRVSWQSELPSAENADSWRLCVMVRPKEVRRETAPVVRVDSKLELKRILPEKADLSPERWSLFFVTIGLKSDVPEVDVENGLRTVEVSLPDSETKTTVILPRGADLSRENWTSYDPETEVWLSAPGDLPGDDKDWKEIRLPNMWEEKGVRWLKADVFVPKSWESLPLFLTVSAIDDNDNTYFNGTEIGRTRGWDTLRQYPIPKELIRFGQKNRILIAAENSHAGGGILRGPIRLGEKMSVENLPGLFPKPELRNEAERRPPRPREKSLPLRPITLRDGVLEYEDGGEVALWGVNYYPQSWNEYRFLKEAGIDGKRAVDADLDDLLAGSGPESPRRIDAIRIHVFDAEISDAEGNLVRNEHLDILDHLVARCNERGIHLWLTPIAWWGSPQGRPDAFSGRIPIQALSLCPDTWPIQGRFLRQFLEHENPYTKNRLVDEPCLTLFEIINEPLYWTYGELCDLHRRSYGRVWSAEDVRDTDADPNVFYRKAIRRLWNRSLPDPSWEAPDTWDYYQYRTVCAYIDTMIEAIRATGARQPIAYSAAGFNTRPPVFQAVADSRCDAVTTVLYPGGLQQTPQADARNLLPQTADTGFPAMLEKKARLVYEFDASDTLRQIDLYPAMARYFRHYGVQVACQFQYDSRFNAAHNRAWPTHYLNAVHTPERFVSFLIAGEVFRTLPRGTTLKPEDPDVWIFPPAAVSYSKNAAFLGKDHLYMQARKPEDWHPLPLPVLPKRIIAVGSTPYFDFDGTGIVDVEFSSESEVLVRINPDVVRLKFDTLQGTPEEPLTRLEQKKHVFRWKIPGWEEAVPQRKTEDGWQREPDSQAGYELESGQIYRFQQRNQER